MADNRSTGRLRTLLSGVLYDEEGRAWECSISDVSEGGARIKSKTEVELEMFVDLKINKFNDVRQTKVMWKRESYTGLQFTVKIDKGKGPMSEFFKLMQRREAIPSSMAKPFSTDNLIAKLNKLVA